MNCAEKLIYRALSARPMVLRLLTRGSCSLAFLTLTAVTQASASVVFQTGFEPSPTETPGYDLGELAGQNGWFGASGVTVENSTVFSGSQAVSYSATGLSGPNIIGHPLTYNSVANPDQIVTIDMKFEESATGERSVWDAVDVYGNPGFTFIAQIVVGTLGNASAGFGTLVPVTRGTWNDYQLTLNFATGVVSASVNSQSLGSGTFTATSLYTVDLGINSSPGSDTGFWDQVSVTETAATPEPGSAGLLLAAIGLMVARKSSGRW